MGTQAIRFARPKAPRHQLVLYGQSLDELVAADGPVRALAALLDAVDWSPWEQAYTGYGQPPIHPRYVAGAILFGLLRKVRSTRELEEASCKHLDFIWLLEGFTPDHSTFAKFRQRHAEAIKDLHRHMAQALVRKREKALLRLIIDGTRFRADSDRHGMRTASTIKAIIRELNRRLEVLGQHDEEAIGAAEYVEGPGPPEDDADKLARLNAHIAQLQAQRATYQKALDVARQRDARARKHNGNNAKPVRVPVTDPESQVTPNKEGGYAPNYTPVATVESQTGAIVHADVLPGSDEASAVMPAVEAAQTLTDQKPDAVLADGHFASGEVLEALDADGIDAYMPTRSASPPDNPALREDPATPVAEPDRQRLPKHGRQYARTAFVYDAQTDVYRCPMGHALTPHKHGKNKHGVPCAYYQGSACPECPLAPDCIGGKRAFRTITRDAHQPLREAANQRMATPEGQHIYKARAPGIEGVFGVIKSCLGLRRFTVRGLAKVRTEWTWICTAYNLKKLLTLEARALSRTPEPPTPQGKGPQKRSLRRTAPVLGTQYLHRIQQRVLRPWQAHEPGLCTMKTAMA
jgi:transposase